MVLTISRPVSTMDNVLRVEIILDRSYYLAKSEYQNLGGGTIFFLSFLAPLTTVSGAYQIAQRRPSSVVRPSSTILQIASPPTVFKQS